MHARLMHAAAGAAVIGAVLTGQPSALAARDAATDVPCSVAALVLAMSGARSGTTLSLAPRCVYSLSQSLPPVRRNLILTGNQATLIRSSAPGTPAFSILRADAGALTVNDLNFRNGHRAITVTGAARLTVNGGIFSGNSAVDGGAILDRSTSNGPKVTDTVFTSNSATGSGGAIFNVSGLAGVNLTHATFVANTAGNGGAIYDFSVDGQHVTNSVFADNTASACGAACFFSASSMTFTDVVVRGNTASGSAGGIYASASDAVRIIGGQFSGNQAGDLGGGIFLSGIRTSVDGTVMDNNTAADGAGLYATAEKLSLGHVTMTGNQASGYGGGIYNDWASSGSQSSHTADDSQISGNSAGSGGGGVYDVISGSFVLTSSRVLGNSPDNCEPVASVSGCGG